MQRWLAPLKQSFIFSFYRILDNIPSIHVSLSPKNAYLLISNVNYTISIALRNDKRKLAFCRDMIFKQKKNLSLPLLRNTQTK